MIANIKISIFSTFLALAFFFTPLNGFAQINIYRSPALQAIFDQADAIYTKRLMAGMTNRIAMNTVPELFAMSVGMTMQRQFNYLNTNRDYLPQYMALEEEALNFMYQLAKVHNYRNPANGSNLHELEMTLAFYHGLKGKMNAIMIQKTGIDPANANLPFILTKVPPPKNTGGNIDSRGALMVKEKNEINLFGNLAPAAESAQTFKNVIAPPQQTQSAPAAPLTECSIVKFTIKPTTAPSAVGYFDIHLVCTPAYITKVVVTYNNQLKREMGKSGPGNTWTEFNDFFSPSHFSLKDPYYLTFEAFNGNGEVVCRGKTQYHFKSKNKPQKKKRY